MKPNHFFQPKKIALGVSLAVGVASSVAIAQDVDETKEERAMEEVIVTASYRASIERAIEIKRNSSNIVDAISAEDIGKLPDSSIADSLGRISGLTTQRLDGRAAVVTVRGFGENESLTTLNGREQVSIGDSRGVEFDLYPSEIMSGVTVYKTPSANMIGEGIAGVIDLRTVSPLSRSERTIKLNAQYEMNEHEALVPGFEDTGHRATLAYIDQFADDTVGVALAVTTMESPGQEKHFGRHGGPFIIQADGSDWIKGANLKARSSLLERDSVLGVVEFQPNESLKVTLDGLYVDFSDERYVGAVEMGFNGCIEGWLACDYTGLATDGSLVTSAQFPDMPTYIKNNQESRDAELTNLGMNVLWDIDDSWTIELDASRSSVERNLYQFAVFGGAASGDFSGELVSYSLSPNGSAGQFSQTLDYSDPSVAGLGDVMGWGLAGEQSIQKIEDELTAFAANITKRFDSGWIESVEFGGRYREREKTKNVEYYKQDINPAALNANTNVAAIPQQYIMGTVDLNHVGFGNSLVFDQTAILNSGSIYDTTDVTYSWGKINSAFNVSEDVTSFFVQANFNGEVADLPVHGNVGVRYVDTDQGSIGEAFGWSGIAEDLNYSHSYSNVLPSLNVIVDLRDNMALRLGVSKNISRPIMDDMKGRILIEPTSWSGAVDDTDEYGNYWKASGGNYRLESRETTGYDLSFEHYFADEAYYSIAYFYKDITNWNFDSVFIRDVDLSPEALATHAASANIPGFSETATTFYVKENGGEGSLWGMEFSLTLPLDVLNDSLSGFGIQLSHTMVEQDLKDFAGNDYELPGLSDKYSSGTVYYENNGLQVRVSARKRSDYLARTYSTIGLEPNQAFGVGETLIDAQIGYDVSDNLYVFLQAQNLTNEEFHIKFEDSTYATDQLLDYGASYQLGVSYQF